MSIVTSKISLTRVPLTEPPCRVDKWGVAAGAKLLVIKEAYAVESEEDPNAKIQAYCSAQVLLLL